MNFVNNLFKFQLDDFQRSFLNSYNVHFLAERLFQIPYGFFLVGYLKTYVMQSQMGSIAE